MATHAATIRQIQDEYEVETGERPSKDTADVLLDKMCDAFVHAMEGESVEYAVANHPIAAEYLKNRWTGDAGLSLRAAMAVTA